MSKFIHLPMMSSYRRRLRRLRFFNSLVSLLVFGGIALIVISVFLFLWFSRDLPHPDKVRRLEGYSTVILDRSDLPIYDIYQEKNRLPVNLADVPDSLKKATIAIEDKDFYKHQGFDPKGILRAAFNIITLRGFQGGSTLTQQLVKNVLLSGERSFVRKIKEFVLAVQIEKKYSKDEILQMYLNEAPYGGTMWGVESAAEGYFGKHAKDLTIEESAILAGLPQRPSYYAPFGENPKAYLKRAEEVLRRMREDGYISQPQEYEYRRSLGNVEFATGSASFLAPHFVMYVKKQLIERFGEQMVEGGGLKVTTTLDLKLQTEAEKIVGEELEKLKGLKVSNAASLVINPKSGEILAYIGSREYNSKDPDFQGKFDVVDLGYRQPGSALKPITYAVAFQKGYTPASLIMDTETSFPGGEGQKDYQPKNYDGKFRGPVQLRFALGNSINIPAVKMTALVGVRDILKTAYDMGISSLKPTDENVRNLGLSLTLGGGEVRLLDLVPSFGVFATGGIRNDIFSISKVVDKNGKVLYEHRQVTGKRILEEDISFLVSHILYDNNARKEVFGERSYLMVPSRTVSVKTGTTDDKKDNWAIGYTPSIVAGVWVGNNDNTPMHPSLSSGVTGAAPIWNRIMRYALKDKSDEEFRKPDNVISLKIDAYGGGLPKEGKPERSEYFIKNTEPTSVSPIYQKLKLSKSDSNKLANAVEIAQGAFTQKEFIVFKEDDPSSSDGRNRWQEGIDAWLEKQGDPALRPPKDTSSTSENDIIVQIKQPEDQKQIDSNDIQIIAQGRAIKEIKKMEIYIDGSLKKSVEDNIIDETFRLDTGIHKIKIKAYDEKGNTGEREIKIGVKVSPIEPTVTPLSATPTSIIYPTPSPTPI